MNSFTQKYVQIKLSLLNAIIYLGIAVFSSSFVQAETILVHGDSLSAGYGMNPEESWVHLLNQKLSAEHTVINSSISGETTKGGLLRLPALIKTYKPDIILIELGANDGLRGYPIMESTANLQQMINLANNNNIQPVLLGIRLPPNFGKRYTEPFFNQFAQLASTNDLAYLPFLLEGVAQYSDLMQADGLHPTALAQSIIRDNVWGLLQESLGQK